MLALGKALGALKSQGGGPLTGQSHLSISLSWSTRSLGPLRGPLPLAFLYLPLSPFPFPSTSVFDSPSLSGSLCLSLPGISSPCAQGPGRNTHCIRVSRSGLPPPHLPFGPCGTLACTEETMMGLGPRASCLPNLENIPPKATLPSTSHIS